MLPRPVHRRPHAGWWWLIAAWLLAQSLGLVHEIVHARHEAGHPASIRAQWGAPVPEGVLRAWAVVLADGAHADDAHAGADHGEAAAGWTAKLFPHHDTAASCVLFDHASHGSAMPMLPVLAVPVQLLALFLDVHAAPMPWFAARFHQARAPPAFR